jgi:hypothetical protein
MTPVTLQAVKARQAELAGMIEQLQAQASTTYFIPEVAIELRAGERYVGPVLDSDGSVKHHLVLMAERPEGRLDWQSAMTWAQGLGGDLPDRQELALIFANCKPHVEPSWHWSNEVHADDASYAWHCSFSYGNQYYDRKSCEGCAVAARRVS